MGSVEHEMIVDKALAAARDIVDVAAGANEAWERARAIALPEALAEVTRLRQLLVDTLGYYADVDRYVPQWQTDDDGTEGYCVHVLRDRGRRAQAALTSADPDGDTQNVIDTLKREKAALVNLLQAATTDGWEVEPRPEEVTGDPHV